MTSKQVSGHHSNTIVGDDGCEVYPRCLECPLQMCRFDDPKWYKQWLRQKKVQEVIDKREQGTTINELALEFSITPRTVFRMQQEALLAT